MFNFGRRINRKTYYLRLFVTLLIELFIIMATAFVPHNYVVIPGFLLLIGIVYLICLTRQRANDIGWHPLFVTIFVMFWTPVVLVLGAIPGQKTSNKYGSVPS